MEDFIMKPEELLKYLIKASEDMAKAALETRNKYYGKFYGKELERKVDLASVSIFKEYLKNLEAPFKVISEEGFETPKRGGQAQYIILDPVDGTSNLCRGLPFSAISIAVANGDYLESIYLGIVRDIFRGTTYYAIKGRGAFKNGKRISVRRIKKSVKEASAIIAITRAKCGESKILDLLPLIPYPRYLGAASLESCLVAEGIMDIYIDVRNFLRVFDIAAGQLIIKEAGGIVMVMQGGKRTVDLLSKERISIIAASTKNLFNEILSIMGI